MSIAFPRHRKLAHVLTISATIVAMTAALFSGCSSPPKARIDKDSQADFASYKTYGWMDAKPAGAAEPAQVSTLSTTRVRAAISKTMQAKGYTLDEAHPDVRVSYAFHIYQRPKESGMRIGLGAGGGSGNVAGGVGVSVPVGKSTESRGAMSLDFVDVARNAQVWTGSYDMRVSDKETKDTEIQKLVDTILAKYPVHGK
jgi:hypothetical protein